MKKLSTYFVVLVLVILCITLSVQATAVSPVLVDTTQTTVNLQYIDGYEYSKNGTTWQTSPDFTGLTPNTTYTFYQRAAGTAEKSQGLKITTQPKTENPNMPAKPAVIQIEHFTITLQARQGYEYRMDDGQWQDSPVFTNLYSNKEHTFYQRIKSTAEQNASVESEGTVACSLGVGNSTAANHYFLREYVVLYGKLNANGRAQVSFSYDADIYHMEVQGENIYCWTEVYDSSGSTTMHYTTGMLLKPYSQYVETDMYLQMYYNNRLVSSNEMVATIDRRTFTSDTVIPLADIEEGSLLSNLYNASVKMLCAVSSVYAAEKASLTFTDLGFFAYVADITPDICDSGAGAHKGEEEQRYFCATTCTDDGYTGDLCCSFCGEVITAGEKISSKGGHTYDDACDATCNTCGEMRITVHTWNREYQADGTFHWTGCSVCGEKRNVVSCAGGQATCGEPAVCSTCQKPYGDVLPCKTTIQVVDDQYLKTAATCIEASVYYESCPECLKAGTKTFTYGELNPNNHGGGIDYKNPVPETCTQPGYKGDRYCGGCGESLGEGEEIPPQHSFTNYKSNGDATYDADGTETAKCDRCSATNTRTEAGSRIVVTGWYKVSGKWCYYESGVKAREKWIKASAGWCYIDNSGYMVYSKWVKDPKGWCYIDDNGYLVTNKWIKSAGKWSYVDGAGYMATNKWIKSAGKWCYIDNSGYMVYNKWVETSAGWCYIDSAGYMAYNKWVKSASGWYYVDASGYMATNKWIKDAKGWCYLGENGCMISNNWVKDPKGWCYMDGSGYMVYNKWVKTSSGWCYLGSNGYMATNKWIKDTKGWCYVGNSGYMISNNWLQSGSKWYYFNNSGYMVTGWVQVSGNWYYMDSSGVMITGWKQLGGKWYYFYNSGVMATNTVVGSGFIGANGVWDPQGSPYDRVYNTLIYSDSRVDIYFYQLAEDRVWFKVKNKTSVEVTIQADSIAINRVSTDNIIMSGDIAPYSIGYVDAKCTYPGIYTVGEISGQLRVISFSGGFDSYDAPFVNVVVDSSVSVQMPKVNQPLVYTDEKVDVYFAGAYADGVCFTVRNKTNINISIQADTISVNGYSTDRIIMSDDVAPGCVGVVMAKCSPGAYGAAVYKVGGTLRIIDFNYSFKSYDATFINVPV